MKQPVSAVPDTGRQPATPASRHDPLKTVLPLREEAPAAIRWDTEPAVCGYTRLLHHNERLGTDIPVPVSASPVAVPGAGAVVGTYDGLVRFHNRALSRTYWQTALGAPVYASLVADRRRQRVVAATTAGRIVCLDLRGRTVWQAEAETPVYATPAVVPAADLLVVAGFGSRCLGFDLATGKRRFARELPAPWHAEDGSAAHRDPYASPAATTTGSTVVACAEHVLALAPDGSERWRHELGHSVRSSPVVLHDRGEVAVCSVDGRCLFLDLDTGKPLGQVDLGGKVIASPVAAGGLLVAGTQHGRTVGIDVARRAVAWGAPGYGPREYTSYTLLPDGNLTFLSARGNAVGLRREDGHFLWETSQVLGLADHDPALDTTPVVAGDGSMYCGSYTGMLYHFRFRPEENDKERS
ncbi:outer membrane protein assembly factor BamB family protein [Streptomyces sp. TP-A0874]|uniref:outer membrane protein assembly factor BamB family protein n=1 Tax=Streptomyces sp. TP-A0874 TaxID=549819 RepID=UPI000D1B852A|nr:PQQ-binding-like beta-propeller repeat protein [Streptomyces sp. TP-A0874]